MASASSPARPSSAKDRIIAALDVSSVKEAETLARDLAGSVGLAKIGLELFVSEGPAVVRAVQALGLPIFLDLKLHDIPNTVEQAARAAARLGVRMLTVHASGGADMIAAAKRGILAGAELAGSGDEPPLLLAVTVLTSMNDADLQSLGVSSSSRDQVLRLGALAIEAGADGLVCSALEAAPLREALGSGPALVVPGIRPSGGATHDQSRVATPAQAVSWGADWLVIGRPLREGNDPAAAASRIASDIDSAGS